MNMVKVLGIGSPFGDDQIGWEVVKELQQQPNLSSYIDKKLFLKHLDRPNMALLDEMQQADIVFLVDAAQSNAAVGTIHRFRNEDIDSAECFLSSHSIGVIQTMKLGRALGVLPRQVILYGIEIGDVEMKDKLSKEAKVAVSNFIKKFSHEISEYCLMAN